MTNQILMPKSTAIWLIENTSLSFGQIADFCGMHVLEVQALADSETSNFSGGFSPIVNNVLTWEDIRAAEADHNVKLAGNKVLGDFIKESSKVKARYTPMSIRSNRPDAILWLVKNHPELSDAQVCKLARTTKPTVEAIRNRTHKAMADLEPKSPVLLDICSQLELQNAIEAANKKKPA
ncbi:MAG: DUF1013 domain-containing protein [Alphaproteobacteria bacterium]|nr:DUF1013 domain-containing protein [Alphaproteobacteria bacterium]